MPEGITAAGQRPVPGRLRGTLRVKPSKPYPDFPLFPHATGRWCKKINGKFAFFGPWENPHGALERYLAERDALYAGFVPRANGEMRSPTCSSPLGHGMGWFQRQTVTECFGQTTTRERSALQEPSLRRPNLRPTRPVALCPGSRSPTLATPSVCSKTSGDCSSSRMGSTSSTSGTGQGTGRTAAGRPHGERSQPSKGCTLKRLGLRTVPIAGP